MNKFRFFKTTMPITRKADYYLGCLNGSVFIDFNSSKDNRIYLRRISFDGYGCCQLENFENKLNNEDSKIFIKEITREVINQNVTEKLVKKLIKMNAFQIWSDALEEYKLIEK
ncbi:hypothetical protein [Aquimarina sp. AU58]|uniref:hypothetical protein n=1 Tax=Aquimarina sp. AU58 TaxID=1874112 RepID=UPI000D64284E|nr:hypothetical protein [Aquimarina sp. AU58]